MSFRKINLMGVLRVLALVVLVSAVWCVTRDRTTAESWAVPLDYTGDGHQIMGWIKAASEGDYIPFWTETVSRLGAPYQADWNDYPMYEKILTFGLGLFAHWFGLGQATNFGVLLGHILSAISFYLCCRFMRYSKLWSFVAAALFSLTYYNFFRGLGHLLLAFSYTIPWALLSCWIIGGSKRMRLGDRLSWVCLITALVMGLSNPYNLSVYVQLLGFSILVAWLRKRSENVRIGLYGMGIAGVAFIAINIGTLAYQWAHGKNPAAMDRHYYEAELYALKPMEFFIPPPTHMSDSLAKIGSQYISEAYVRGEICSPYLGLIGIAGLVWLFAETFLLFTKNNLRRSKPFPPYGLQSVWVIFYSIIGGLNCLISFGGVQYFRGTNRFSIYISGIILLFLASRMTLYSRRWSTAMNLALASAVLVIGIFDQSPRPIAPEITARAGKIMASDIEFGKLMEQRLPPHTMVFQLPVMEFPEATPIHDVSGYEMLRPYFVTSTLRFSFGSVRGRNREAWQWEVEKMPVPEMVQTLEKYGFGAIYINRKGYEDRAESLLKQLADAGRSEKFEDSLHEQVCVLLKPSPTPELPHTDERAQILFKHGWVVKQHTQLQNQEWSGGDASLTFFSEPPGHCSYTLRCAIGSISPRHVSIIVKGRELWAGEIPPGKSEPVLLTIEGSHGNNAIEFKTDQPPVRPNDTSPPLAFTLINLQIVRTSPY